MNCGKSLEWTIEFDDGFAEDMKGIGHNGRTRIKKYIDKLSKECADPRKRGEPYKGNLHGLWKYRIGNYRLVCQITELGALRLYAITVSHRSVSYSDRRINEILKRKLDV